MAAKREARSVWLPRAKAVWLTLACIAARLAASQSQTQCDLKGPFKQCDILFPPSYVGQSVTVITSSCALEPPRNRSDPSQDQVTLPKKFTLQAFPLPGECPLAIDASEAATWLTQPGSQTGITNLVIKNAALYPAYRHDAFLWPSFLSFTPGSRLAARHVDIYVNTTTWLDYANVLATGPWSAPINQSTDGASYLTIQNTTMASGSRLYDVTLFCVPPLPRPRHFTPDNLVKAFSVLANSTRPTAPRIWEVGADMGMTRAVRASSRIVLPGGANVTIMGMKEPLPRFDLGNLVNAVTVPKGATLTLFYVDLTSLATDPAANTSSDPWPRSVLPMRFFNLPVDGSPSLLVQVSRVSAPMFDVQQLVQWSVVRDIDSMLTKDPKYSWLAREVLDLELAVISNSAVYVKRMRTRSVLYTDVVVLGVPALDQQTAALGSNDTTSGDDQASSGTRFAALGSDRDWAEQLGSSQEVDGPTGESQPQILALVNAQSSVKHATFNLPSSLRYVSTSLTILGGDADKPPTLLLNNLTAPVTVESDATLVFKSLTLSGLTYMTGANQLAVVSSAAAGTRKILGGAQSVGGQGMACLLWAFNIDRGASASTSHQILLNQVQLVLPQQEWDAIKQLTSQAPARRSRHLQGDASSVSLQAGNDPRQFVTLSKVVQASSTTLQVAALTAPGIQGTQVTLVRGGWADNWSLPLLVAQQPTPFPTTEDGSDNGSTDKSGDSTVQASDSSSGSHLAGWKIGLVVFGSVLAFGGLVLYVWAMRKRYQQWIDTYYGDDDDDDDDDDDSEDGSDDGSDLSSVDEGVHTHQVMHNNPMAFSEGLGSSNSSEHDHNPPNNNTPSHTPTTHMNSLRHIMSAGAPGDAGSKGNGAGNVTNSQASSQGLPPVPPAACPPSPPPASSHMHDKCGPSSVLSSSVSNQLVIPACSPGNSAHNHSHGSFSSPTISSLTSPDEDAPIKVCRVQQLQAYGAQSPAASTETLFLNQLFIDGTATAHDDTWSSKSFVLPATTPATAATSPAADCVDDRTAAAQDAQADAHSKQHTSGVVSAQQEAMQQQEEEEEEEGVGEMERWYRPVSSPVASSDLNSIPDCDDNDLDAGSPTGPKLSLNTPGDTRGAMLKTDQDSKSRRVTAERVGGIAGLKPSPRGVSGPAQSPRSRVTTQDHVSSIPDQAHLAGPDASATLVTLHPKDSGKAGLKAASMVQPNSAHVMHVVQWLTGELAGIVQSAGKAARSKSSRKPKQVTSLPGLRWGKFLTSTTHRQLYKGTWYGAPVVVKVRPIHASKDLLSVPATGHAPPGLSACGQAAWAAVMAEALHSSIPPHPNVVQMIACAIQPANGPDVDPLMRISIPGLPPTAATAAAAASVNSVDAGNGGLGKTGQPPHQDCVQAMLVSVLECCTKGNLRGLLDSGVLHTLALVSEGEQQYGGLRQMVKTSSSQGYAASSLESSTLPRLTHVSDGGLSEEAEQDGHEGSTPGQSLCLPQPPFCVELPVWDAEKERRTARAARGAVGDGNRLGKSSTAAVAVVHIGSMQHLVNADRSKVQGLGGSQAGSVAPGVEVRPVSMSGVLSLALDVAQGMAHLHAQGVAHGGLQTSKVLLNAQPQAPTGLCAKVSGFNTPKAQGSRLPPEMQDGSHATLASDVYMYGVLLWELYTCKPVPGGSSPATLAFPASCPLAYCLLASSCMDTQPQLRPSFPDIIQELSRMQRAQDTTPAKLQEGVRWQGQVAAKQLQSPTKLSTGFEIGKHAIVCRNPLYLGSHHSSLAPSLGGAMIS